METLQVFAPLAKLLGMYQIKVWYNYTVAKAKDLHACFVPTMPQVHINRLGLMIEILIFNIIIKYMYFMTWRKLS